MYCKNCNSDIGDFRYCSQCGADNGVVYTADYAQENAYQPNDDASVTEDPERGKAIASMVLGICSIAGVGSFVTAILALVFSNQYLTSGNKASEGFARAGKITGTIGLVLNIVLSVFIALYIIFFFTFIFAMV